MGLKLIATLLGGSAGIYAAHGFLSSYLRIIHGVSEFWAGLLSKKILGAIGASITQSNINYM